VALAFCPKACFLPSVFGSSFALSALKARRGGFSAVNGFLLLVLILARSQKPRAKGQWPDLAFAVAFAFANYQLLITDYLPYRGVIRVK